MWQSRKQAVQITSQLKASKPQGIDVSVSHPFERVTESIVIPDDTWTALNQRLASRPVPGGRRADDERRFITAVLWVLKHRCHWQALPAELGGWRNTQRRFERWRECRTWEWVLEYLLPLEEFQWLLKPARPPLLPTEGSRVAWLCAGGQSLPENVRYVAPWLRMVCRSEKLIMALATPHRQ